ncbi:MAG: stage II sporulation protein P [Defluviitaleaceae bacterium]|nr:stage II sporulation protein P [Defluviitaleaceae bacterium]
MLRSGTLEKMATGVAILLIVVGIFANRYQVMGIGLTVINSYIESVLTVRTNNRSFEDIFLENNLEYIDGLIGINDLMFELEEIIKESTFPMPNLGVDIEAKMERLRNFDYLRTQFYVADWNTGLLPSDVDVDAFLHADLTIDTEPPRGPRVLIFHTHSTEMFADSNHNNPMDGVIGLGAHLAEILERQYGIPTLHDTTRYDIVDGVSMRMGAYERMEPYIRRILEDNPTIEIVIDLHRDGLPEGMPPMISYINGQRAARIMFVNGLSRRRNNDDVLEPVPWLPNPYLRDNLAFSFQLQMSANRLYPGIARRVYLKAFRYSLHLMPRSTLIEVGAQNNTMQEAHNSIPHLAAIIADVILP